MKQLGFSKSDVKVSTIHFITTTLKKFLSNLCLVPGMKKNVTILQNDLHVNREDICFLYRVEKQKLKKIEDTWLWSNHEEADTKMISHV